MGLDDRTQESLAKIIPKGRVGESSDLQKLAVFLIKMADDIKSGIKITNPVSTVRINNLSSIKPLKSVQTEKKMYAVRYENDSNGNVIYAGEAVPGSPENKDLWRIKKFTYENNFVTTTDWADGITTFTKKWEKRAEYRYEN